ncbi:hypothetical protein FGD67_01690 [Colwellia sp. M166]|uniref:VPA1267 family protein n=1 Tax=Colwellia sp. M166 TaxID=2583805 RepID=UPI00211EE84A|nr:VPA1267 family protein [Colwellia sp. M166]UUO22052.1 hypothetical protein FGD67_01690 [Colwellia sp. M166]
MSSVSGDNSVKLFETWRDSMSDQDYVDIIFRGKLNRKNIAEQCGFAKSVLGSNQTIKDDLKKLEDGLRERLVLPALTTKGEKEERAPKTLQRESLKAAREQSRVPDLEQRIVELEAENKVLRANKGRLSEFAEVYEELSKL